MKHCTGIIDNDNYYTNVPIEFDKDNIYKFVIDNLHRNFCIVDESNTIIIEYSTFLFKGSNSYKFEKPNKKYLDLWKDVTSRVWSYIFNPLQKPRFRYDEVNECVEIITHKELEVLIKRY